MAENEKMPEERFLGYIGEAISNENLQCRDCKHCIKGNTAECNIYEQKPGAVLRGDKECGEYEKND